MSVGVWKCENCGYSVGASREDVSWSCPRCNGKRDYVDNLIEENNNLKKKVVKLEKQNSELEKYVTYSSNSFVHWNLM